MSLIIREQPINTTLTDLCPWKGEQGFNDFETYSFLQGLSEQDFQSMKRVEVYNPATMRWEAVDPLDIQTLWKKGLTSLHLSKLLDQGISLNRAARLSDLCRNADRETTVFKKILLLDERLLPFDEPANPLPVCEIASQSLLKKVSEHCVNNINYLKEFCTLFANAVLESPTVYRNNLKDREFGKEAPQDLSSERGAIAERQGASENTNAEVKPTPPKTDSSGYFGIKQVKEILATGTSEEQVDKLQNLAFSIFQPPIHLSFYSPHKTILEYLLCVEHPDPSDVASVLLKAQAEFIKQNKPIKTPSPSGAFPSWNADKADIGPDTLLTVSHGGGLRHLDAFFKGHGQGYVSEAGGRGIFFTVHHPKYASEAHRTRDMDYATRSPIRYLDTPAIITGKIPAKYLKQVNHNSYEAVLLPEDAQHFTPESFRSYPMRKMSPEERQQAMSQTLPPVQIHRIGGRIGVDYESTLWSQVKNDYPPERLERLKKHMREVNPHAV